MKLKMCRAQFQELRRHGEQAYPYECCGVLVGKYIGNMKMVEAVLPCNNTRTDSPRNRYSIDPRELIAIQRNATESGKEIVGFYHSHPDHPAHWSATDLAEAYWTGCSYVITSVAQGQAVVTNSYVLLGEEEKKYFEQESLEVEETEGSPAAQG